MMISMLFLPLVLAGASCSTVTQQDATSEKEQAAVNTTNSTQTPTPTAENSASPSATPFAENTNANGVGGSEPNTNASVDTSYWVTYTNQQIGMSMKVPQNYVVEREEPLQSKAGKGYLIVLKNNEDKRYSIEATSADYLPNYYEGNRLYMNGDYITPLTSETIQQELEKRNLLVKDILFIGDQRWIYIQEGKYGVNSIRPNAIVQQKTLENFSFISLTADWIAESTTDDAFIDEIEQYKKSKEYFELLEIVQNIQIVS